MEYNISQKVVICSLWTVCPCLISNLFLTFIIKGLAPFRIQLKIHLRIKSVFYGDPDYVCIFCEAFVTIL